MVPGGKKKASEESKILRENDCGDNEAPSHALTDSCSRRREGRGEAAAQSYVFWFF